MCAPAAQRASSKPRSELPTRPTAAGIVRRIPAVDLWTTRQSMQPSAKKCYPCCRIKVLPMLPVAQNEASFHAGCCERKSRHLDFLRVLNTLLTGRLFVEQFEERVDTLHQLTPNLRARTFDQMHRDAAGAAVVQPHTGILDRDDAVRPEHPHPVDQRGALSRALHQFEPARHRVASFGPRVYRPSCVIACFRRCSVVARRACVLPFSCCVVARRASAFIFQAACSVVAAPCVRHLFPLSVVATPCERRLFSAT